MCKLLLSGEGSLPGSSVKTQYHLGWDLKFTYHPQLIVCTVQKGTGEGGTFGFSPGLGLGSYWNVYVIIR